jgi:hypothetical protein
MSTVIVQRLKRPIDCDDNRALYDASRLGGRGAERLRPQSKLPWLPSNPPNGEAVSDGGPL